MISTSVMKVLNFLEKMFVDSVSFTLFHFVNIHIFFIIEILNSKSPRRHVFFSNQIFLL